MNLLTLAIAPVFIIAIYVYFRDKYEKEPISLLIKALILGCIIPLPVLFLENFLVKIMPELSNGWKAFYTAFVVAGFSEELFKFIALFILIWANRNFNEKFDGIVYAVFISLGFAGVENVLYVFEHGAATGYVRALVSVPGHAFFGVTMGYFFGLARFYPHKRILLLFKSLLIPIILHGIFDFILMHGNYLLLALFLPYVIFLYIDGLKKMKNLSDSSFILIDDEQQV